MIADILFFAALAAFVFYRLYSVLGRKDGTEEQITHRVKEMWDAKANQSARDMAMPATGFKPKAAAKATAATPLETTLEEIGSRDRSFSPTLFLNGANAAFEMVLEAFAKGDHETLKSLLDTGIYKEFEQSIAEREKEQETMTFTLVSCDSEITDARLEKNLATIMVKFTSEQIQAIKDKSGNVVDGSLTQSHTITDTWTFTRHLTSNNPNWTLVDTGE